MQLTQAEGRPEPCAGASNPVVAADQARNVRILPRADARRVRVLVAPVHALGRLGLEVPQPGQLQDAAAAHLVR